MNEQFFVNSNLTKGHYAFKTLKSKKPFENPMSECMKLKLLPDDVVVDIGAYVGEYSIICHNAGVKRIISYEATPETFELLLKNKKETMEIHNVAIVGGYGKQIELFISKGIGVTNSIAKRKNKVKSITIPSMKYDDAIKDATIVKIDVEGAEYGFRIVENLNHLRGIIIEFHPMVGFDWEKKANDILNKIEENNFTALHRATFKSGWSYISAYVRETK